MARCPAGSRLPQVINIYCSLKIIFLHVDVKERTVPAV